MKALTRLPPGFGRSTLPHIQTVWSGGLMKMSWDGKKNGIKERFHFLKTRI